jgi:SAM-dependent methyltransferase
MTEPAQTHEHQHRHGGTLSETLLALSMTVSRGRVARAAADLAGVGPGDRLVDVGCGPGTAMREAVRRGATATGVDPSAPARRLGRWITPSRWKEDAVFVEGSAESLPVPDEGATILWSLSAVHHWRDRARGLAEAHRVLAPGGRLLLSERLLAPTARWHAGHGVTDEDADDLTQAVEAAGFVDADRQVRKAGKRTLVVVTASAPPAPPQKG